MTARIAATYHARQYERDGYVAPLPAITAGEAVEILDEITIFRDRFGGDAAPVLRHKPHLVLPSFARLVRDPRITDKVAEILGPDLLCWTTNLFAKSPGDGMRVSWHQDGTYWGLDSNSVVTAWVALTDSNPESGCLRVIPGSHTWPQQPHRDTYARDNLLTRGQEIAVEVDESKAADLVLRPGEMSLHHVMIAHASEPNRSAGPRMGVAIRYISAAVRQTSAMDDSATLARGRDPYGNFKPEPRPAALADPAALAAHRQSIESINRLLYRQTIQPDAEAENRSNSR